MAVKRFQKRAAVLSEAEGDLAGFAFLYDVGTEVPGEIDAVARAKLARGPGEGLPGLGR